MTVERIDGIKYENWDLEPEDVVRGVHDAITARIDALEADRDRVAGHMVMRGWMTVDEAITGQDQLPFDEIPLEALGDRPL